MYLWEKHCGQQEESGQAGAVLALYKGGKRCVEGQSAEALRIVSPEGYVRGH